MIQISPKAKKIIIFLALFIIVSLAGLYFFKDKLPPLFTTKPAYNEAWRLVPEKISQSASIKISLPPNIGTDEARNNIKFLPELKGSWADTTESKALVFKPEAKLTLNRYYGVELLTADKGSIRADFLAVEDPQILAIFPKTDSETTENSEITIVFNRPMVPLTTLGYLEAKDVPVELTPATEGKFKWITTRNLQFIPKERLVRSSNYTVKIKSGLISMDGLSISGAENKFSTRHLRYTGLTNAKIGYNDSENVNALVYDRPITVSFNQPVDLERTKKEIILTDPNGKDIPFIAQYKVEPQNENNNEVGRKSGGILAGLGFFNLGGNKPSATNVNQSVIEIYNQRDRFGREKLWDFDTDYYFTIKKAYPAEGDIILDETRNTSARTTGPINNITAESDRSSFADPDFFDPQGKLWVSFWENIDLGKSKISRPYAKEINYGEKCTDENLSLNSPDCQKTTDQKRIYMTFDADKIRVGEKMNVVFESIVNTSGLTINREPIARQLSVYPEFKILSTTPKDKSKDAELIRITICSNTPVATPADEDMKNSLILHPEYELNYWGGSQRVHSESSVQYLRCNVGEFSTTVSYGLIPQAAYTLELKISDVFGQKASSSIAFTTGNMPDQNLSFFQLQPNYNVTTPDKTSLSFATKNMEYVNVDICKMDAPVFLETLTDRPQWTEPPSASSNCIKKTTDRIELPKRYWVKNYFKLDLKKYFPDPLGHYLITFHNPNYTTQYWQNGATSRRQVYERSYLSVTNLGLAEKRVNLQSATWGDNQALSDKDANKLSNLYWVTDLSTLQPINGATISMYRKVSNNNLVAAGSFFTNDQGIASPKAIYDLGGIIASKGGDSTIIPIYEGNLSYGSPAFAAYKMYVYTDKPIYRPEQEVAIKGLYRIGYDGSYEIFRDKKVTMKIINSKDEEISNQDLDVNEFGTVNTKFTLPKDAPLGTYRACANQASCAQFEVQEYVPAPFKVEIASDKAEYISKDTANLSVQADYYFGVPVDGGQVEYAISSQNYYFDRYTDGSFDFDSGWYYWPPYNYGEKFITRGTATLSHDGKANISQLLDIDKLFKNKEDKKSKIIVVDVTVKNGSGQSVSGQKSFILHQGEYYLGLSLDKYFMGKNEDFNLKVKSVDIQGKALAAKNLTLGIYKVDWVYNKRQEASGGYSYKWEKQRKQVTSFDLSTDGKGDYTQKTSLAEEGEYEAEVVGQDSRGNSILKTTDLYVYGPKQANVEPTENTALNIDVKKAMLNVGEKGEIIIKSPYTHAKALISIERGNIFSYEIKDIEGSIYPYSFDIKEEYIPNVFVSVLLVSPKPEIKFGQIEFKVNTDHEQITVDVKSNKKTYLPGEEVTLDITTTDYQMKPVATELSMAVVDLSVLALQGNPKKNPLIFFYGGFPLTVSTSSNVKNILVETNIPTKGGGGGEGNDEELGKKKRGEFKETAFWQATAVTDQNGKAQIKFTLPDNLTTWQAETLGITKDTKLGINYSEFMTKKDLMVIPLKPRFIIPGDTFYVGAQIFNQSSSNQNLKVTLASPTLILQNDTGQKDVAIASGQSQTIYFPVLAPAQIENGAHTFTLSAKGAALEDTVEQSIKITRNDTYETTATSNYTQDTTAKEYVFLPDNIIKDKGTLTIKKSATLAVFLSDALNYLLGYPYGCAEQIASKLDSIAIVKRGLNLPNITDKFNVKNVEFDGKEYTIDQLVEIGLTKLYNNQRGDGGFALWQDYGDSSFYTTLHVVDTLTNLKKAGYNVRQEAIDQAVNYLNHSVTNDSRYYRDRNTIILTAYTLYNTGSFSDNGLLKQKLAEAIKDNAFMTDQISNTSLAYLGIIVTNDFDNNLKKKVLDTLDNRINIDSRGAFLETNNNFLWYYYDTPVKNTALYLKVLAASKSKNPITEKVLRWLLASRAKDGAWGSTNNTISAIDAFTDYLTWKKETESDFVLNTLLNGTNIDSYHFEPKTILDQPQKTLAIKDLKFNINNEVFFTKENKNNMPNSFYYDMALKYFLPEDQVPPRDEGFSITREYYGVDDKKNATPLREAKTGDVLRAHLEITVPISRKFVAVEDFIPAGMEIVNLDLATEQKSLLLQDNEFTGNELYTDFKELRDDRAFLYTDNLEPGVYEYDYYVRALIKGKYSLLPAVASEMYFPENFGRTEGRYFEIK